MKFTEFEFNENLQKGIAGAGFVDCTPVQEETFKFLFEGRDIYAQSQTGTGKTGAFVISAMHLMAENEDFKGRKTLIIAPTRELAVQIEKETELLGSSMGFSIGSFYGGVGYNSQEKKLSEGCDIIIGTPGRLIDFGKSGKIDFSQIGICIIDEADRLFDMGFLPDLRTILRRMPPREERRTMLYSATLSSKVGNLAWEHLNNPGEIVIEPENVTVEAISQELYHVGGDEKMRLLLGILNRENPETAIIFTNTKHGAYEVAKRLEHNGYQAKCLMGDLPQKKRLQIVDETKEGKVKFLVATDVAARGLHIDDLAMVVNYDIPQDCENYVHRIGRTARAGKTGKAVSLACEKYVYGLPAVEKFIDMKIPVAWADETLFTEDKSEGMRFHLRDSNNMADRSSRGRRDDGRSRSRDRDRDRSRDRDHGRSGERDRDRKKTYPNNRRPLEQSEKRVQNMVLEASGVGNFLNAETPAPNKNTGGKPKKKSGQDSRKDNRREGGKDNRSHTRAPQDRQRHHKPQTGKSQQNDQARVSGKNSMDDRLAYYRSKYGEDFKVDENTVKKDKERQRQTKKKNIDKKPEKKPTHKPASKTVDIPAKKGLFSRLFGKK